MKNLAASSLFHAINSVTYDQKWHPPMFRQTPSVRIKDPKEKSPDCHQKCENWYHFKHQNIDKEQFKNLGDIVWIYLN